MKLGIVGHAEDKFTSGTERRARAAIREAINDFGATVIVSGRSPLGGVDVWAEEEAAALNLHTEIFPPTVMEWEARGGFKERNLKIAEASDLVLCIVVRELPPMYEGMTFPLCYHCKGRNPEHVKSGGCWTAWKAKARAWVIIEPDEPGHPTNCVCPDCAGGEYYEP